MLRIGRNCCPYCEGSSNIYVSRCQGPWEAAAIVLLLRPVRCHDCFFRFYRPVFVNVPPPPKIASMTGRKSEEPADSDQDDRRSA
jgi:hypothetical protein